MRCEFILADAFHLPLRDGSADVIVADPPYEGRWRGKRHLPTKGTGYVMFSGRSWWKEAWRVLAPSGSLYIFTTIKELPRWLREIPHAPIDILSWYQPNGISLSSFWRRGISGRPPCWRPILHYQKPPKKHLVWVDGMVQPNVLDHCQIQSNNHEALPWPNQLPRAVVDSLLAPHVGLVLDLFSGTGTAGESACRRGMPCISVDMSHQALSLGKSRNKAVPLPGFES